MTVRPRISVLIITYKRSEEAAEALANVLALQPAPDEIIVYDDDPDASARAVVPEDDPRVRYVCQHSNAGPARRAQSGRRGGNRRYAVIHR